MRVALRFLVMVMLLTVLSPKFGWESVSAAQAHVHTARVAYDEKAGHETHGGCHQHDAAVNDDMGDHHCCPGHVLGHLPGGVGTAPGLPQAGKSAVLPSDHAVRFSSRTPEGLERPPRAAA